VDEQDYQGMMDVVSDVFGPFFTKIVKGKVEIDVPAPARPAGPLIGYGDPIEISSWVRVVNALRSEQVWPSDMSICADYPKGLPFPTERFATQEKAGETALQASLRDSAEEMLLLANSLVFVTRMALQANLPMWQTFR